MHPEILSDSQQKLLPLIAKFSRTFGLVGGTAVAYHIGHRESIDFDLFSYKEFNNSRIKSKIEYFSGIDATIVKKGGEYTMMIHDVKITFFQYPYEIAYTDNFCGVIKTPDLLTLAAMKAFALGRRAKWKDYVDMYFILRDYHSVADICKQSVAVFKQEFNEKIFRVQLSYFKDIDYTEPVIYQPGFAVPDDEVKNALIEYSLS